MSKHAIVSLHDDIMKTAAMEAKIGDRTWEDLRENDNIQGQRRFLIACAIPAFRQIDGINTIVYYSGTEMMSRQCTRQIRGREGGDL